MRSFETFECSDQILSNSFRQFWNSELIPLQIFCIPLQFHERLLLCAFLAQTIYTLLIRSPLKWKFLRLSSAQIKIHQITQFWNDKSIPLQILHHSSLSWHTTPLWILSSYFSYFGLNDPINIPILRLSIAPVKIYHIPHVIFLTTSQFFFKFCIILQCNER